MNSGQFGQSSMQVICESIEDGVVSANAPATHPRLFERLPSSVRASD